MWNELDQVKRKITRMSRTRIVILGGVGSGIIVAAAIDAIAATGRPIELVGFLDDGLPAGETLGAARVLGPFERWREQAGDVVFVSAIPKPKQAWTRHHRILSLGIPADRWVTIVHPDAHVATDAVLGPGTYVGPLTVIEPGAVVGAHGCLRGGCYLSHDVRLGEYVFVGPNACVLGRAKLADGVHIGANAACREAVTIGRYAVVGLGAAVVRDVAEFAVVAGSPARVIGEVRPPAPP